MSTVAGDAAGPLADVELRDPQGDRFERLRRRTLTVSVEGPALRAVAFVGDRVAAWATIDLDATEAASLPPELAAFARGRSRQLSDLPFYASLVRHLEKPAARRRYVDQVVAVEVGNTIPFATEEIDLRWKLIRDGRGPGVMAWAVPRWETDAYVQLVGLVGIRPAASYSKAVALSAAVGRSNAAIAHLTSSEAELVLVRDHVPRRVHRVELSPAPEDATAYAGALAQAIEELCAADPTDAEHHRPAGLPVVLTGQVPSDPAHAAALVEAFGERLHEPVRSLDHPAGFPALEYAANVGLMLADRHRPRMPWRQSPEQQVVLDLLPRRHRRRQVPTRAIAITVLFGALAAATLAATSVVQRVESWAVAQEADVAGIRRQVQVGSVAAAREVSMRLKLDVLAAQVQSLDDEARANREAVALLVDRARLLTGGPSVAVSDVTLAGGAVRVSGEAGSYEAVVAFAEALRAGGLFDELRTTDASGTPREGDDAGGVAFNITGSYGTEAEPGEEETP